MGVFSNCNELESVKLDLSNINKLRDLDFILMGVIS